jgi:hypothetical protein
MRKSKYSEAQIVAILQEAARRRRGFGAELAATM